MEARPPDPAIQAPLDPGPEDLPSLQEPDTGHQLVEPDHLQLDPDMELPLPTVDHDLESLLRDLDPDLPLQPVLDTEPLLLEVQDVVDHQLDQDLEALPQEIDPDLHLQPVLDTEPLLPEDPELVDPLPDLQPDQDTELLLLEDLDVVDHLLDQDLEALLPDLDRGLPPQPDQDTELLLPEDPELVDPLPDLDVADHLQVQDSEARLPDPSSDLLLQPGLDTDLLLSEVQDVVNPLPDPGSDRPLQLDPDTELPVHLPDLLPRPAMVPQAPRGTMVAPGVVPAPETDPLPL